MMRRYLNKVIAFMSRRWAMLKRFDYARIGAALIGLMEILPGLIAWLVEVCALLASAICVVQAVRLGVELRFYAALILIALSAMLVGLAILTDYYTRPHQSKQGGGG